MRTILSLLLLFPLIAFGADVSTPPTAPTIPATITDTPNEATIKNDTTANKVYIQQAGANINANINQTGQGNRVGTGTSVQAFTINGDNQAITTVQTGNNNTLRGNITTGTGNDASATFTLQQLGDNNYMHIECGSGTLALCQKFDFNALFNGNDNSLNFNGSGHHITTAITVNGGSNILNMDILSDKNAQVISVTGDSNTLSMKQEGGVTNGQSINVSLIGTGNSITTYQGGLVDSLINVNSVGNNGTFNFNITN